MNWNTNSRAEILLYELATRLALLLTVKILIVAVIVTALFGRRQCDSLEPSQGRR